MASQGSENWKEIELWLQKVYTLQDSLKPYDISDFTNDHISTTEKVPPWIGTRNMESAFQTTRPESEVGGGFGTTPALPALQLP
jgi:hypothetical protein